MPPPAYTVEHHDLVYAEPDGEPLRARVYRPSGAGRDLPALVDVHGGAWHFFDRTADAVFDQALAAGGMIVVALDFRQAPAHRYPASVADVIAGIRYVKAHAAALGARPDDVGLIGGSSGGHLALVAALRPHAAEFGLTPVCGADARSIDASVAYALPLWPIADPLARYRYLLDRRAHPEIPSRDRFFQCERLIAAHDAYFGDQVTMARASVPRMLAGGEAERLPPIWIAHPELDENVTLPMSQHLAEAYRGAGGRAELELFPGVGHAFANFPGEPADRCVARMQEFIGRQLGWADP
jgi:acetyl esterase/lipase